MTEIAIDTNLLVYAHNISSPRHEAAKRFVERVMNERDASGRLGVCLPAQVLLEFVHVITWQRLVTPLSLESAVQIVQDYLATGIRVLVQQPNHVQTFLELLSSSKTRRKVFDIALAATLRDNQVTGLYTVNVDDFRGFEFLQTVDPLADEPIRS